MSQKKNEQGSKEYVSDSFVNTIWNQYEDALQRSRKLRENRYEAYVKALEETAKFNSEVRKAVSSFYGETKKANEELINSFQRNQSEEVAIQGIGEKREALRNQWKDVASRWEKIMLTPFKTSFDIVERMEKRVIDNSQSYLQDLKKRSQERSTAADEYIRLARTTQQRYVRRIEDSFKVLVGSGENRQ
ncbi:hypothetical protein [Bacillus sp. V5-8f]|uniref:hypothetical protein n=1 Tax=Bacillus sp. V5-8f TaxID=2053044 RepID=UPI0015E088ED|nr:hypothetical protein [Bacillus sp. V5-8f]